MNAGKIFIGSLATLCGLGFVYSECKLIGAQAQFYSELQRADFVKEFHGYILGGFDDDKNGTIDRIYKLETDIGKRTILYANDDLFEEHSKELQGS